MKIKAIPFALALAASLGAAGSAAAQSAPQGAGYSEAELAVIKAKMNPACSEEAKTIVANQVRGNIEDFVRRSEASMMPPSPIGDLSCLSGLMAAPLDTFSGIGSVLGTLGADLSSQSTSALSGLGGAITSRICDYAAEKWGDLTQPLTGTLNAATGRLDLSPQGIWANLNPALGGAMNQSTGSSGRMGASSAPAATQQSAPGGTLPSQTVFQNLIGGQTP